MELNFLWTMKKSLEKNKMQTKFNVGDKVWYVNRLGRYLQSVRIDSITITINGIYYLCLPSNIGKINAPEVDLYHLPSEALAILDQPETKT